MDSQKGPVCGSLAAASRTATQLVPFDYTARIAPPRRKRSPRFEVGRSTFQETLEGGKFTAAGGAPEVAHDGWARKSPLSISEPVIACHHCPTVTTCLPHCHTSIPMIFRFSEKFGRVLGSWPPPATAHPNRVKHVLSGHRIDLLHRSASARSDAMAFGNKSIGKTLMTLDDP